MLIAITSGGQSLDSPIDERFGRARYIIIYETEKKSFEAFDNQANLERAQGAGIQTASEMAVKGVKWVLTGHVGPKAEAVLKKAEIKMGVGISGTVRDVVDKFYNGVYEE